MEYENEKKEEKEERRRRMEEEKEEEEKEEEEESCNRGKKSLSTLRWQFGHPNHDRHRNRQAELLGFSTFSKKKKMSSIWVRGKSCPDMPDTNYNFGT